MHTLIPLKLKIGGAVFLILALFCSGLWLYQTINGEGLIDFKAIWTVANGVVTVITGLVLLLSIEKVFSLLYRPVLVSKLGLPVVLGKWTGSIRSNYTRLDKLRLAAANSLGARWDADSPGFIDQIALLDRPATLEIKGSLWNVRVIVSTTPAQDGHPGILSESVVAKLIRNPNGTVSIWYLYDAQVNGERRGNDSASHRGAAILTFQRAFNLDSEHRANGEYWTQRNWSKGMNTAGLLSFTYEEL